MRILIVADGRSPTTRRWIKAVTALGHVVTLITTFPCEPVEGVEADVCLPVAFSALAGSGTPGSSAAGRKNGLRRMISAFRAPLLAARYRLGPLTLRYYGPRLRWLVERIQPDLIHALRLPFEGMLASYAPASIPLAVSIWGNDLTLHAHGSSTMAALTRRTLARANALVADAGRDIRLGHAWGFDLSKPTLIVPGNGGLDLAEVEQARQQARIQPNLQDPPIPPLVLNPRGFRTGSVRQDTFFQSIPFILQRREQAGLPLPTFACAAMAGQREALDWLDRLHLHGKVELLPLLPQDQLWSLFARAAVTISVSQHDGTPNSLLEGMALGAFPVAGDIESVREWIIPGVNGLLIEPDKPQALAEAILLALDNPALRARAAERNAEIIRQRASADVVQGQIEKLYCQLTGAVS